MAGGEQAKAEAEAEAEAVEAEEWERRMSSGLADSSFTSLHTTNEWRRINSVCRKGVFACNTCDWREV